ncbi:MAG TPA: hypothetical protein DIT32_03615 [Peptococcaceae bacterium]|nr:hypothetical protein [Peptococcaceae bacterium]
MLYCIFGTTQYTRIVQLHRKEGGIMNEISAKLLELITSKNISYSDLSELTGIPKSALQRYATGTTDKIPVDRIVKIANALGADPRDILGWGSQDTPLIVRNEELEECINILHERPEMKALFSLSKKATKEQIEQTIKIIEALNKD